MKLNSLVVDRSNSGETSSTSQLFNYATLALLFIVSLALYARTMAPGLLDGDEGEFQINMFRLGVSHTGYPTFFLLGKLWTILVPIGTIATRANLFSAFWGALTIAAVLLFIQFLTHNRWAAILSALLLLGSRVEWSQAVIPRPYTLNSLFVVVVPFLLFLWRTGKVDLTVPFFAFGASLTNHRTIMWFGPAIAIFVLMADYQSVFGGYHLNGSVSSTLVEWIRRSTLFKPRRLVSLAVAFALPLLLYGYIWWRGESDVGVEFHWKDFNAEILGGYVSASWRFGPLDWLVSRVTELYIPMLIEQFTPVGFVAGLVGMIALAFDRRPRGWPEKLPVREVLLFIVLANLANTAFCVIFWVIDIDKFFLPSFITFLFFIGIGIAVVVDWLGRVNSKQPQVPRGPAGSTVNSKGRALNTQHAIRTTAFASRILQLATRNSRLAVLFTIYCLLLTAAAFLVFKNYSLNDWSRRTDVTEAWDENLAQPLEPHAVIAGSWESITPLEYAMYVDGRRMDLERWKLIVNNYQLGQVLYGSRQEDIEKAVREGRPVYLTVYPGETETLGALADEFRLVRVGELWRVLSLPPRDDNKMGELKARKPLAAFVDREGESIELLGYTIRPAQALESGDFALATLYWREPHSIPARLVVSFRLMDAEGHLISQRDSEPAGGLRPTNGWADNEIVQDDIGFFIPPDAPPGAYHLAVVVYNSGTGEELKAGRGTAFPLDDLQVTRPSESVPSDILNIPHPLDQAIAALRLRGYSLASEQLEGGDPLDLSLWWQLGDPASHDQAISIVLQDASGRKSELYFGAPIAGFPITGWGTEAILRGRYTLALPLDLSGRAKLIVDSGGKSAELGELDILPSGRTFTVPPISHPQVAQIGDSIKLLGYDLDKTSARPGDTVRLTLYWQALKQPPDSYTVFAHVLDASGVLRGQKDSLPHGGEQPTDRWLPGQVIVDPYDITLAPDAPSGGYQFEVGMYLADTGARVPVLDQNGVRVPEDRVAIGTLKVSR